MCAIVRICPLLACDREVRLLQASVFRSGMRAPCMRLPFKRCARQPLEGCRAHRPRLPPGDYGAELYAGTNRRDATVYQKISWGCPAPERLRAEYRTTRLGATTRSREGARDVKQRHGAHYVSSPETQLLYEDLSGSFLFARLWAISQVP